MNKCYSSDEEAYYREFYDVLDGMDGSGDELKVGMTYWEGEADLPKPSGFFSVDCLVENMQNRASDECGEWAETYMTDIPEKIAELKSLIDGWLDSNVKISFFSVKNTIEKKLTQEDIELYRNS